jgi:hypothetical protein
MSPSDGPPARFTRAAQKARRNSAHDLQNMPPHEETSSTAEDSESRRIVTPASSEESRLTSIAETSDIEVRPNEEETSPTNKSESDHSTIRDIPEEYDIFQNEPEQSYTTAPGSNSLSAGPSTFATPSEVPLNKGKGRALSTPSQATSSSHRSNRETSIHEPTTEEEWARLDDALRKWSQDVERSKEDITRDRREINNRLDSSDLRIHKLDDTIKDIRRTMSNIRTRAQSPAILPETPRALASQAIYHERGSREGSADYERRKNAQA